MKRDKVICWHNLPMRPPILLGAVLWLMLDRLVVSGSWVVGVCWSIYGFLWIVWLSHIFVRSRVDIFDESKSSKRQPNGVRQFEGN